jgi:hypothetical protein
MEGRASTSSATRIGEFHWQNDEILKALETLFSKVLVTDEGDYGCFIF